MTLKVIDTLEDRSLVVSYEADTSFLYGMESNTAILKQLDERRLLVNEILNYYKIESKEQLRNFKADSTMLAQKNEILNLELQKRTLINRLGECEQTQDAADLDAEINKEIIKDQNRRIKFLRLWSRIKTGFSVALAGAVIYLALF